MTADIIDILLITNLAGSIAIIAVLALRGAVRRLAGAQIAYLSWLVVPAAVIACLIPARIVTIEAPAPIASSIVPAPAAMTRLDTSSPAYPLATEPTLAPVESVPPSPSGPTTVQSSEIDWALGLVLVWAVVAIGALIFLFLRQSIAVRALGPLARVSGNVSKAAESMIGPAVVGIFAPRIVLPANFETIFDDTERKVVMAHEEAHLRGRHTAVKAITEIAVCLSWFNPLAHIAARAIAMDQELACDEAVVQRYPEHRKAYAAVLLKNQTGPRAPLGCYWPAGSAGGLKTRITQIKSAPPDRKRRIVGGSVLVLLAATAAGAAWASKAPQTRIVVATAQGQAEQLPSSAASRDQASNPSPHPARFELEATPLTVTGRVEKIDFREQSYVLFIRASYVAAPPPNSMNTFWGAQPNTALWELNPTNDFGDAKAREALVRDLTNREVKVTGFSATPEICKPACRMKVETLQVVQPTALPSLSQQSAFSLADMAVRYDVLKAATVRGTVQRLEFSDRMFDAYLRVSGAGGQPGALYQVRSEYRFPRADIERQLLNKTIVVAGWPSKTNGDTVCETGCGYYATDIELPDRTRLTPMGDALVSTLKPAFRNEPGVPPTIMPGHFDYMDSMDVFDVTTPVTIEGKIVRQDNEGILVEAQRFEPVSVPGAKPGTLWRVFWRAAVAGQPPWRDAAGRTITVHGFMARNKNCQPTCTMSWGDSWVR
jgi:beta-lactamase regulating signal transducer with metallopeptidase domain